jgi:hypothetical protein
MLERVLNQNIRRENDQGHGHKGDDEIAVVDLVHDKPVLKQRKLKPRNNAKRAAPRPPAEQKDDPAIRN